ncbi:MAG TPA: hypothetical protein VK887_12265 [Pseudonocardiaceae bacterium]|nr:hypothetical protein [Pseudonocardiaceae bacterium]
MVPAAAPPATRISTNPQATAHVHDARLYTRNAEGLKGLEDHLEIVAV